MNPSASPAPAPGPLAPATLTRRFAALSYDVLVLAAVLMCYTLVVVLLRGLRAIDPGTWWFEASLIAISALFYSWFWTHGGQTLGMRVWRIRVVGRDGRKVGWGRAIARFFAAWLSALPVGLGYWWGLIDAQSRCWHDRMSHTLLVRVEPKSR